MEPEKIMYITTVALGTCGILITFSLIDLCKTNGAVKKLQTYGGVKNDQDK